GKLVAEALRPSDTAGALPWLGYEGQRRRPGPRFLEQPDLPLPPDPGVLPRAPAVATRQPVRPRPLPADPPLARNRRAPVPPRREQLPSGPLVRLPAPDVNQPVPLPVLARALPD